MHSHGFVPVSTVDNDSPFSPSSSSPLVPLTSFTFNITDPEVFPLDLQLKMLSYLNLRELVLCSSLNRKYFELTDDPELWAQFMGPKARVRLANQAYADCRNLFFNRIHLRKPAYILAGLEQFNSQQLSQLLNNTTALHRLLLSKYRANFQAAMVSLSSEAVKALVINHHLTLDQAADLDQNAVTILGYSWIQKLCRKGNAPLAIALTAYPRHLIYSENTRLNITNERLTQLRLNGELSLDEVIYLSPTERLNLENAGVRAPLQIEEVEEAEEEAEAPNEKRCCRIS